MKEFDIGDQVKYFCSTGTRFDGQRNYYNATIRYTLGKDDDGNTIYALKCEHTDQDRFVSKYMIELQ